MVFRGIDFTRQDNSYEMSQTRFIDTVLRHFSITDCKPVPTPADTNLQLRKSTDDKPTDYPYRQAVGSPIYLMTATRPDLSWIVSKLSQFLERPKTSHVSDMKQVFCYLQGTKSHKLLYTPTGPKLIGYSYADWGGNFNNQ